MAGARPKPTAMKMLAGNPGKRPINQQEPQLKAELPEMPKGMGRVANREWKWLAPALKQVGCIARVDGKAFGEYCKAVEMAEAYYRIARANPMVEEPIFNKEGLEVGSKIKANPAMAAYVSASKLMKSYLIEFGLTPASRTKLKVNKPKDEDEMEQYLAGRESVKPLPESATGPTHFDIGAAADKADLSFDA